MGQLSQSWRLKQKAYQRVDYLKGASLCKAIALSANIRLGWTGLLGENNLAYYKILLIME